MTTDPYPHLESLDDSTLAFVAEANQQTHQTFMQSPYFHDVRQAVLNTLQDEKQIPFCQEHRGRMYHFYQSAEYPKGVYRVAKAVNYRAGLPQWQILFNVADFDEVLADDVYLDGVSHYVEQPLRVLLSLSAAGRDAAYTLEFDLATGQIVPGGLHFPLGKNHVSWRDEDSVWVCPAWDERQCTEAGYAREVWLIERGQSFEEGTPVFQIDASDMMVNAWRYLDSKGTPIDLIEASSSFFQKTYLYVGPDLQPQPLKLPKTADVVGYIGGQLLLRLTETWVRNKKRYEAGSLLALSLSKGSLGTATVLFAPTATQALESVETTKNHIVLSLLDEVKGRLAVWRYDASGWNEVATPMLPSGAIDMVDQPWGTDTVYLACSDFVTPLTLYALDVSLMELVVVRKQPKQFDPSGVTVAQYWANSDDGVAIPYFWVGQQATPDTPTLVYVYGGFGVPELPHYLGTVGKHWLEQGGAFVLANVRGGGEFGPQWHRAAQGRNKHKSVDDLLAIVADLSVSGRSSAAKIAIQGGSNGGLVVASAYARAPERIGAMVCEVPLTDMLRYDELYAGASWVEEYGDPKCPNTVDSLLALSPYHQIATAKAYPPALLTTSLTDDRVHPGHAIKFYARLRDQKAPAYLYVSDNGGHTGNGTQAQTAEEMAVIMAFLKKSLITNHQ